MTLASPPSSAAITNKIGKRRPGELRLWMLEEASTFEQLCSERSLYNNPDWIMGLVYCPDQYAWLREQVAQRLAYSSEHYPWYGWAVTKPDLRYWRANLDNDEKKYVRLELSISEERVALFDHCRWCDCVLNRRYISATEAEEQSWQAELAGVNLNKNFYLSQLPAFLHSKLLGSWEQIFDTRDVTEECIWAAFEKLELSDVVTVTEFTTRPK